MKLFSLFFRFCFTFRFYHYFDIFFDDACGGAVEQIFRIFFDDVARGAAILFVLLLNIYRRRQDDFPQILVSCSNWIFLHPYNINGSELHGSYQRE